MSAEYDAACEVRAAIDSLDDKDRGLTRIADAMERLADVSEIALLRQLMAADGAPTELNIRAKKAFGLKIEAWIA